MTKEETKTFLELLAEVPDHRKGNAIQYELKDILFLGIIAILCGANTYTGMALFTELHYDELAKYVHLRKLPSHDIFGDIFSRVDTAAVNMCFEVFLKSYRNQKNSEHKDIVVAMDGKTIRRSQSKEHKAAHIETAYISDMQLVLGQVATDEKSNEITAIPQLLELLTVKGSTVTIDAMGTQTAIATKIREKELDYILAVKENQPTLYSDIELYAKEDVLPSGTEELEKQGRYATTLDKGHGRIEKRECFLFGDVSWLTENHAWTDLNGVAVIRSTRMSQNDENKSVSLRYFIYSHKDMTAERFLSLQRKHWAIENNLHWSLDCCFHEDDAHVRMGHAAIVLNMFRKLCMQMLKADTTAKGSMASKRQRCAWSFDFACTIIDQWISASIPSIS